MPLLLSMTFLYAACLKVVLMMQSVYTYLILALSLGTYLYYVLDAKYCQPQDCLGSGNYEAASKAVACC